MQEGSRQGRLNLPHFEQVQKKEETVWEGGEGAEAVKGLSLSKATCFISKSAGYKNLGLTRVSCSAWQFPPVKRG